MYNVKLTDEQIGDLFRVLDLDLKTNGLTSLSRVVSLHNTLLSPTPVEVEKVDQPEEDSEPAGEGA